MSANGGFGGEYAGFSGSLAESELIAAKKMNFTQKSHHWVRRKITFSQMNSIGLFPCGN